MDNENTMWRECQGNCTGNTCYVCNYDQDVLEKEISFDRFDPCYLCNYTEECQTTPDFIFTSNCAKYSKCTNIPKLNRELIRLHKIFEKKFDTRK